MGTPEPRSRDEDAGQPSGAGRLLDRARESGRYLGQAMKMVIGVPDYDAYVEHVRRNHPGEKPMTRREFLDDRMMARYGRGRGGCC